MLTLGFMRFLTLQFKVVLLLFLCGCSVKYEDINNYNLLTDVYTNNGIPITVGLPEGVLGSTLRVYIEGDGRAWVSKYHPSTNPTPTNSLVLKLMQLDSEKIIYLARPCQYHLYDVCKQDFWTEGRHSAKMVQVMNYAISQLKEKYNAENIELIGHSGGGAMAVLIAAQRQDVTKIITVAGNLDVEYFTNYHKVTPMVGSLNPMDYVEDVKNIPQLHLTGGEDKAVPPALVKRFVQKAHSDCVQYKEYPQNGHHKGWQNVWKDILQMPISCYGKPNE